MQSPIQKTSTTTQTISSIDKAPMNYRYELFICHAGEAGAVKTKAAFPLATLFNYSCGEEFAFFDQTSLSEGQKPQFKILNAVSTSRILLVIVSKAFFKSDYPLGELETFLKQLELTEASDRTIVPIFYEIDADSCADLQESYLCLPKDSNDHTDQSNFTDEQRRALGQRLAAFTGREVSRQYKKDTKGIAEKDKEGHFWVEVALSFLKNPVLFPQGSPITERLQMLEETTFKNRLWHIYQSACLFHEHVDKPTPQIFNSFLEDLERGKRMQFIAFNQELRQELMAAQSQKITSRMQPNLSPALMDYLQRLQNHIEQNESKLFLEVWEQLTPMCDTICSSSEAIRQIGEYLDPLSFAFLEANYSYEQIITLCEPWLEHRYQANKPYWIAQLKTIAQRYQKAGRHHVSIPLNEKTATWNELQKAAAEIPQWRARHAALPVVPTPADQTVILSLEQARAQVKEWLNARASQASAQTIDQFCRYFTTTAQTFSESALQAALEDLVRNRQTIENYCQDYRSRNPIQKFMEELNLTPNHEEAHFIKKWKKLADFIKRDPNQQAFIPTIGKHLSDLTKYLPRLNRALANTQAAHDVAMCCYLPFLEHPKNSDTSADCWRKQLARISRDYCHAGSYVNAKLVASVALAFYEKKEIKPPLDILYSLVTICLLTTHKRKRYNEEQYEEERYLGEAMLFVVYAQSLVSSDNERAQCQRWIRMVEDNGTANLILQNQLIERHVSTVNAQTFNQQLLQLAKTLEATGNRLWEAAYAQRSCCLEIISHKTIPHNTDDVFSALPKHTTHALIHCLIAGQPTRPWQLYRRGQDAEIDISEMNDVPDLLTGQSFESLMQDNDRKNKIADKISLHEGQIPVLSQHCYAQAKACYKSVDKLAKKFTEQFSSEKLGELENYVRSYLQDMKHGHFPEDNETCLQRLQNNTPTSIRETIKESLKPLREPLPATIEKLDLPPPWQTTSTTLKNTFKMLLAFGESLLGASPLPYAVMGIGSLARDEACPYSDLEFIFVTQDSDSKQLKLATKRYLKALMQWIELQLIALGETQSIAVWPRSIYTKLAIPMVAGFRLDEGGNIPCSVKDPDSYLIGTAEELIAMHCRVLGDGMPEDLIITNALQGAAYLSGEENCAKNFRTRLMAYLRQNQLNQKLATALLREHLNNPEFNPVLDENTTEINIKKGFLRLPTFIIETLALYAGINETSSKARLNALVEKEYISQAMADALLTCLYFGLELRTQAHRHYGREHDIVYLQPPNTADTTNPYVLSPKQSQWLKLFYQTMLFTSKSLVKESLQLKVDANDLRTEQKALLRNTILYEQALQCFPQLIQQLRQRALELRSYYRFEEALRLSRFSLLINKDLEDNQAYQAFVEAYLKLMTRYDATDNVHEKQRLRDQLIHLPEANGVRASTLYKQCRWQRELMSITEPPTDTIPPNQLSIEGLHLGKRLLNTQVSTKFIQGLLNKSNAYGTHPVIRVDFGQCSFYFKLYPEYPGNEKAAYLLMERILGSGAPESELCQIIDSRGTSYPVLIIRTVPGKNIKESYSDPVEDKLKANPQKKEETIQALKTIDAALFSRLFIAALLTSNEDGKTDNIMLHRQYTLQNETSLKSNDGKPLQSLTFIDIERCFLPAVALVDKQIQLQMKQFLFCMDQMNDPVPVAIKKEINRLDPYRLLNEWLNDLEDENCRCLRVFGQDKICHYSNLSDKSPKSSHQRFFKPTINLPGHPVVLPVMFVNDAEEHLFANLRYLKILWEKHPDITHRELLQRLEPVAFKSYRQTFADPSGTNSLSRWKILEGKYYQIGKQGEAVSTTKGTTIAMQTLAIKTKQSLAQLMQGQLKCCYAPGMSQHRLLRHYQIHTIQEELKKGQTTGFMQLMTDTMRKQVLEEMPFKSIPVETQAVIFKAVKDICFTHLVIKHAEGLTDSLLQNLLASSGEYLVSVELIDCPQLTETSVSNLAYYCPNLQRLSLISLSGLKYIYQTSYLQRTALTDRTLTMSALTHLKIQSCQNLKQIDLWSPVLEIEHIEINDHTIKAEVLVRWVQFLYTKHYKGNSTLLQKTFDAVTTGKGVLEFAESTLIPSEKEQLYFTRLLKWNIPIKRVNIPSFNMNQEKLINIFLVSDTDKDNGSPAGLLFCRLKDMLGTWRTGGIDELNCFEHTLLVAPKNSIKIVTENAIRPHWNYEDSFRNKDIGMLCIACDNQIDGARYARQWLQAFDRYAPEHCLKIIVLIKRHLEADTPNLVKNFAAEYEYGIPYFECSTITGEGVVELFRSAVLLYLKSQNKAISFVETLQRDFPAISIEGFELETEKKSEVRTSLKDNVILDLVMHADLQGVEAKIKANPKLLYKQGDITDLSERSFKGITAFQYAVWACDKPMCEMIVHYLPTEEAAKQLAALENHPQQFSSYESQFNFGPLISQYNILTSDFFRGHDEEDFYKEQYKMPMWYVYKFTEQGYSTAWTEKNPQIPYLRTAETASRWYKDAKIGKGWYRGGQYREHADSTTRLHEIPIVDFRKLEGEISNEIWHDKEMTELEEQAAKAYRQELRQRLLGDKHMLTTQSSAYASVGLFSNTSTNAALQPVVQTEQAEKKQEQPSDYSSVTIT